MAGSVSLKLALAQIDPTVGDIEGNAAKVRDWIARARERGAGVVLFPELCLPGYPAEDLYLKPHFVAENERALRELAAEAREVVALVGFAEAGDADDGAFAPVHNSLAMLAEGAVQQVYRKIRLPNYGVFDEERYFEPGGEPAVVELAGQLIGLTVCEDIWFPGPPGSFEASRGARAILNASASPYHRGKGMERERMVGARAQEYGAAIALCNTVGGQDELVFDGHSVVVDASGQTIARGPQFEEALVIAELRPDGSGEGEGELAPLLEPEEAEIYGALRLGLRDYVDKNGFERVGVALSGGIDSALVAVLAADAVGPDRLTCVVMPSPHSSAETQGDAREIARRLGCELVEIPIGEAMETYDHALSASLDGADTGLALENLQARIRGNLMMALSNARGLLVLTTGNKSEMSVGYATLYGDMAGGFAVIKDVPKTLVYALARHRNAQPDAPIPDSVLERAPSAELRPGQLDTDSLPAYEVLDRILAEYVERDRGRDQIVAEGLPADVVDDVIHKVDLAEYKRRQAPPGIKITPKAFGRDRRLPITNRYRG
jgi:NAD+ synthase (glutamine-hydrolysing)